LDLVHLETLAETYAAYGLLGVKHVDLAEVLFQLPLGEVLGLVVRQGAAA